MKMDEGSAGALIRIQLERIEPLSGTAAIPDGRERPFEGWMELIGAIADLVGSTDHPRIDDPAGGVEG